jgi:hypothetical protein
MLPIKRIIEKENKELKECLRVNQPFSVIILRLLLYLLKHYSINNKYCIFLILMYYKNIKER